MSKPFSKIAQLPLVKRAASWGAVEKLRHLRVILRHHKIGGVELNMNHWFDLSTVNECGTAACAAGYAALDPTFKALGLQIDRKDWENDPTSWTIKYQGADLSSGMTMDTMDHLAEFFGVSRDVAWDLFNPQSYVRRPIIYDDVISKLGSHIFALEGAGA